MYRVLLCAMLAAPVTAQQVPAQQYDAREYLELLKTAPGETIHDKIKALDAQGIRLSAAGPRVKSPQSSDAELWQAPPQADGTVPPPPKSWRFLQPQTTDAKSFLRTLNSSRFDPNSVSSPFGTYGYVLSPESVNNLYGMYGGPFASYSAKNPNTSQVPGLASPNSDYVGRFGVRYDLGTGNSSSGSSFPGPRNPYNPYAPNLSATPQAPGTGRFSAIPQR